MESSRESLHAHSAASPASRSADVLLYAYSTDLAIQRVVAGVGSLESAGTAHLGRVGVSGRFAGSLGESRITLRKASMASPTASLRPLDPPHVTGFWAFLYNSLQAVVAAARASSDPNTSVTL